jgi:hypothetical protein
MKQCPNSSSLYQVCLLFITGRTYNLYNQTNHSSVTIRRDRCIHSRIGYARSPEGLTWWKDLANNPVLSPCSTGAWDDELVVVPDVIWIGGQYVMWYGGCDGTLCQTGYATSEVVFTNKLPLLK